MLFFFSSVPLFGQTTAGEEIIDSLEAVLANAPNDSSRVDLMIELSVAHGKANEARAYGQKALELAHTSENKQCIALAFDNLSRYYLLQDHYKQAEEQALNAIEIWTSLKNKTSLATAFHAMGTIKRKQGDFYPSLQYFGKALQLRKELKDKKGTAEVQNEMGIVHKNLGEFAAALDYYFKALKIRKAINDEKGIAGTLNNIGVVHKIQGDAVQALEFYFESLKIREAVNDRSGIAGSYNNIGVVYRYQKKYEEALAYFEKALAIRNEMGDKRNASFTLNNIGLIHKHQGDFETALEYYFKSLKIKTDIGDKFGLVSAHINIAEVHKDWGDVSTAENYYLEGLVIAEEIGAKEYTLNIYQDLGQLYMTIGDYKKANEYTLQYASVKDSIVNEENSRAIAEMQAKYNNESQQREILLLKKDKELKESEAERNATIRNSLVISFFLVLIVVIILYRSMRFARKSKVELEEKNKELQETLISKEEKEVMLKEIHHRVKNNLQVINSLIRLQSTKVDDDAKVMELFQECQNRVKSMALLHEELYQTKDLANVNVDNYLTTLIRGLVDTYSVNTKINLNTNITITTLGVDTLIPVGLVVNEIISNSLKHAFNGVAEGNIDVTLKAVGEKQYQLQISDNGKGFDADFSLEHSETLGIELIKTLVDQLDGTLELPEGKGVAYNINFQNIDK